MHESGLVQKYALQNCFKNMKRNQKLGHFATSASLIALFAFQIFVTDEEEQFTRGFGDSSDWMLGRYNGILCLREALPYQKYSFF